MIKMIAVDMDGTFLDENGRYDIERFEKILEELEKREILFVVATGNQISRMRHILVSNQIDWLTLSAMAVTLL